MTISEGAVGDRPRPLPVRLRPTAGETTDSYVRRVARANHLKPSYLRAYLAGPPDYGQRKRPRADRLAAVTGRRQEALERALTDLVRQKRQDPARPKRRVTTSAEKPAIFAAIRRDINKGERSVRVLAERHHVSPRLVRQALESPTPPPRKKRPAIEGPAKARVAPAIDTIVSEYAAMHGGQLPTVRLVWEKLLDEYDATVSYGTVHRFMSAHPLKNPNTLTSYQDRTAGNFLGAVHQTFQTGVFQHYRALLTAVRRDPARHGLDGTFASTTAFVLGLDAGSSWHLLAGLQEWLVVRLGRGHDLTWPVLIRHLAPGGWVHPLTDQADAWAVITLHQLLGEYFEQRQQPGGLATIFRNYQEWLVTQSWYQFSPPETNQID